MAELAVDGSKAPQLAFVAGGGAIKAYAFHLGVLRGLEQDGVRFRAGTRWKPVIAPGLSREVDTYVGSSAGACIVASLASGHSIDEMHRAIVGTSRSVPTFGYRVMFAPVAPHPVRYARRLLRRASLGILRPHHLLDFAGVVSAAGMERYFRKYVLPTNRFVDLAPRLFLVATQLNGSRKVVFGPVDSMGDQGYDTECAWYDNVEISEALAAAVSLPPLFTPYGITNPATGKVFHYHDGEVREPLSVNVARDAGARFAIASSIWRPYGWQERVGSLADFGMMTLAEQALHQMIEQKVARDRAHADQVRQALELIEQHCLRHGLDRKAMGAMQADVGRVLRYRNMRVLRVEPEPRDTELFFGASFRFNAAMIQRSVDAGTRAYQHATKVDPGFFPELDQAVKDAARLEPGRHLRSVG